MNDARFVVGRDGWVSGCFASATEDGSKVMWERLRVEVGAEVMERMKEVRVMVVAVEEGQRTERVTGGYPLGEEEVLSLTATCWPLDALVPLLLELVQRVPAAEGCEGVTMHKLVLLFAPAVRSYLRMKGELNWTATERTLFRLLARNEEGVL